MNETALENTKIQIEDMGYNAFFESNRRKLKLDNFSIARVMVEHKGIYRVKSITGEYLAKITGKQVFNALSREDYPVVGDWVAIKEINKEQAVIHGILPRKTTIKRKYIGKNEAQVIATNIDVALIVESVNQDYSLNRFERYFAITKSEGIKPVIILNKVDLISKDELNLKLAQIKDRFSDTDFIFTSTVANQGLDELKRYIAKRKTYCFLGSSGVGKSSLINKLLGKNIIKTEDINIRIGRGKHITTHREMYFLKNGGIVIDNPGMREVGMIDTGVGIDDLFDEITLLAKKCKYINCKHIQEPGCEVLSALDSDKLNASKYANYIKLKKEVEHYEMTRIEKRKKNRQFGKFIKKAKRQIKKHKY